MTTCWRRAFTGTRPSPLSWRLPPANRPSSCPSVTTGPRRPRSSMNHAAMSWSTLPAATCETTPGAKSSSQRPRTASSPSPNGCARAASSTRPRSGPQPTGSFSDSGVARCFSTKIAHGIFTWDYDEKAMDYEETLLAGRYVITTSLDNKTASTAQVVAHYKALQSVERRFRVLKDFFALRPVFHYTEKRVRGHVAICVLAAVIEAVMALDLAASKDHRPGPRGPTAHRPSGPSRARAHTHDPLCRRERQRTTGHHAPWPVPGQDPRRLWRRHLRLALARRLTKPDHGL